MEGELEDWQLLLLAEARRCDDPTVVEQSDSEALQRARSLLDQADGVDRPVVVEDETARKVDKAEALLDAAHGISEQKATAVLEASYPLDTDDATDALEDAADHDDWEMVDADKRERECDALEAVQSFLSSALRDNHGLRDEVVEAMDAPTMVSQFRDEDDGDFSLESLSQQPETGGATDDEAGSAGGSGGAGGSGNSGGDGDIDSLSVDERKTVKQKLDKADLLGDRTPKRTEALRSEAASIVGVDDADDIDMEAL